ncbi:hypothetical protein HRTV-11_gp110 [Halorubrum virus HRTV-11]|nr:hypothetical protein HRTV-11_gp110 [Halorubrum virus HRTV-11]
MSEDNVADEVASWLNNAATLMDEAPKGVAIVAEFPSGELRKEFGDVELEARSPKESETQTPKGSEQEPDDAEGVTDEASLRDEWQSIASEDWNKFQSLASEHGVTEGDGPTRISTLVEMGATPDGEAVEVANSDGEAVEDTRKFGELPKDEQDELRKEFENDPEGVIETVKDRLEDGEDYAAFGGECPAEQHDHDQSPIGRNFDENGFKPFCAGCLRKKTGFHLTTLTEGENDIFSTLIEGGKNPEEALEAVQ